MISMTDDLRCRRKKTFMAYLIYYAIIFLPVLRKPRITSFNIANLQTEIRIRVILDKNSSLGWGEAEST
jgi:hypothetical protein